ncbi:MAG: hypothetical protein J6Q05_01350 [Elusimicrobiaceae bacterium]|nr:hypothetical protein [Elusimicrobiaceae bacterium]
MSLSSKIELENLIFARAALLKTTVHAKYGGLISPSEDLELQTLLYVYNVNFRAENFAVFCTPQDALEQRQAYLAQRTRSPGLTRIYNAKQLNFELILSEEK